MLRPLHSCTIALLLLLPASRLMAEQLRYAELVGRLTDLERLASPPLPGERGGASTSHDRRSAFDAASGRYREWGSNDDGPGFIRREGDAQVMVDLQGPGVLWRLWSAMPKEGKMKIFLDGNPEPVIDQSFVGFFDSLEKKYPGLAMTLSRGRNTFVPISFSKSCKVTVEPGWGAYFHATHTLFPEGTEVESFPGFTSEVVAALEKASEAWARRGATESPHPADPRAQVIRRTLELPPGGSHEIAVAGSGAVRSLRVRALDLPKEGIPQEDALREMDLAIHWDGEESPSVWAPLGDFFGTSPGANAYATRPMGCSADGTFYSHWFMPFGNGMRLVLGNDGTAPRKVLVEMETVPLAQERAAELMRFRAAWHGGDFTGLDEPRFRKQGGDRWPDWPLLVVPGSGRYVGMSQHIWKFGGWWGEGDEKFFVDGEEFPSTIGTGSEDYIGYAWAADPPFVTFDSASASVSRIRPDAQEDTAVCRFHLCDDVPFQRGFQGFIEVMPNRDCRPAVYEASVYWYGNDGAKNPYREVPMEERRHLRPTRDMKHVMPATLGIPAPRPGQSEGEGEDMKVLQASGGEYRMQDMAGYDGGPWSGEAQLLWTEATPGDVLELEFEVEESGSHTLSAAFTKAVDYGIFELSIDGRPLEAWFDFHADAVKSTGEIPLGAHELEAGPHVLAVKVVGRSPRSQVGATGGHVFGLDYLRVSKAAR